MKMRHITACLLLIGLLISQEGFSQNFIGMNKDEIIKVMRETQRKFKLNTTNENPHYNYLKYENKIDEITILYFLSDKNECTMIRKMCDYSNINDVIAELNSSYKKAGKNAWTYNDKGKIYTVNLTEEEWYFTVTTKLKEK